MHLIPGTFIALLSGIYANEKLLLEVKMKKIQSIIEDLWIAVTFAEAGAYEILDAKRDQPVSSAVARARA